MNKHEHPKTKITACKHKMQYCKVCDVWQCLKCEKEWATHPSNIWAPNVGTSTTTSPPWETTTFTYTTT